MMLITVLIKSFTFAKSGSKEAKLMQTKEKRSKEDGQENCLLNMKKRRIDFGIETMINAKCLKLKRRSLIQIKILLVKSEY